MASVYKKYKEKVMQGGLNTNLSAGTVKAVFVSSAYTYSDSHEFKSSLSGIMQSSGVDAAVTISNKVFTNGCFKTTDGTSLLTAVTASATTYNAIVLYVDSGSAGSSPLVAYINGLSVTPNGGNITIDWDDVSTLNGVTGNVIFAL